MAGAGQRDCVVLIHGLFLSGWALALLAWRMRRRGFDTRLFSYPSVRADFSRNRARLATFLHSVNAPKVHLLAHSMGGMLALAVLASEPGLRRGRLVLLGTPGQGSCVADHLGRHRAGAWLLGGCMPQANALAPYAAPEDVAVGVIAGIKAVGLGRLVTRLPAPNDGTVTLSETQVAGATAQTRVNLTHTGLILAPSVADLAASFFRTDAFGRDPA
jgi:pimeloyl-ACP methyl ester carboxylesterase